MPTLKIVNQVFERDSCASKARRSIQNLRISHKVRLMRQKNGATQTMEVDYKRIIETGDVRNDPVLQDGDRIYVPKAFIRF